jgi:GDA1/CD39 (nucleoside phosphatase) family
MAYHTTDSRRQWTLFALISILAFLFYISIYHSVTAESSDVTSTLEDDFLNLKLGSSAAKWDDFIPTRRYGIVIDAGSSGSRVNVYAWNVAEKIHQPVKIEKANQTMFQMKEKPGT